MNWPEKCQKKTYPNDVDLVASVRLNEDMADVVVKGIKNGHQGHDLRFEVGPVRRNVAVDVCHVCCPSVSAVWSKFPMG